MNHNCDLFLFCLRLNYFGQAFGHVWEAYTPGRGACVLSIEVRQSNDDTSIFFGKDGDLFLPEITGVRETMDK